MSETIQAPERFEVQEQLEELPEHAGEQFKELPHEQEHSQDQLESTARQAVEQAEQGVDAVEIPSDEPAAAAGPMLITPETRRANLTSTLKHVQRRLPVAERALSHVVHQPAIKAISEVSSKTVSRPSGLLGGGICAFLGSFSYLYLAKHIGFQYNYLLILLFFAGGFMLGLMIELLLFVARAKHGQ